MRSPPRMPAQIAKIIWYLFRISKGAFCVKEKALSHDFCTELKTAISSLDFQKSPSSLRGLKSSLRSLRNSWGRLVASLYSRVIGSFKSMSKLRLHWEKKLAQFGVINGQNYGCLGLYLEIATETILVSRWVCLSHLAGFWEFVYKTESKMGKENGSGGFADSNWRGEKIQVLFGILGRFRFRLGVNKRNLINISVIKINPLTIEPWVMWRYFDFELLRFVISN